MFSVFEEIIAARPHFVKPHHRHASEKCFQPVLLFTSGVRWAQTAPALCVNLSNLEPIMTATLAFAAPAAGIPSRITKRLRELAAFSAPFMVGGVALHLLLAC